MQVYCRSEAPPAEAGGRSDTTGGTSIGELVEAVRAGDPAAREQLFTTYAVTVRRVLGRNLRRDSEQADLLHDVFVAAFEGIHQLHDPKALPGWLSQIAINVARAHVRRRVRQRDLAELLMHAHQRRPHLDHQASEAALSVNELVARLPKAQRAPFALRFMAEMELSEVAHSCSLSIPTVKRRLAAARRRLGRLHVDAPLA